MSAHATFTGDATQLFKVVDQIEEKVNNLKKLTTALGFKAQFARGTLGELRATAKKAAELIGGSTSVKMKAVIEYVDAIRKLKSAMARNINVKINPYVTNADLKTVRDRIGNQIKGKAVEIGLRFQAGAAGAFRETLKRILAVLSRGSYVDVQLRLRGALRQLDGIKGRKITVDVDVAPGTAAKIKALQSLLKSLKEGVKVPVKLDIDPGLAVVLRALAKDLKTAADQASRLNQRLGASAGTVTRLRNAGASITPAFTKFRDVLMSLASATIVVQGLHAVFAGLKDALVDFPARLQEIKVGLVGLFSGDETKATDLLQRLKEFAIPTPFETTQLAGMAQQGLAFNLVDKRQKNAATELIALMRDVGDAAYGLGRGKEGADRLLLAFGQMKTATRVMGQEMLQLQQLGINAWQYLAEATGKSTKEVRALVTKGLIPADEAIRAIRAGLQRDFGGAMERAAKTWTGALSASADAIRTRLADAFAPQFQRVTDLAVQFADFLSGPKFATAANRFAGYVTQAFDQIGVGFRFLSDLVTHNVELFEAPFNIASKNAKYLIPILYAVAAGYAVIKVSATQAAIAEGLAATAGTIGKMTGLAAAVGKLALSYRSLAAVPSIFAFIASSSGGFAAANSIVASLTASISGLSLAVLPVLAAAIGVAAIAWQTYREKAVRVTAANADLEFSTKQINAEFEKLSRVSAVNPQLGDTVAKLKSQFDELGSSVEGLQQFQANLRFAERKVNITTGLKPLDRAVLIAEIRRIEQMTNEQLAAAKFKAEVEVEANPLSLSNLIKAFKENGDYLIRDLKVVMTNQFPAVFAAGFALTSRPAKEFWHGLVTGFRDAKDNILQILDFLTLGLVSGLTSLLAKASKTIGDWWNAAKKWYLGQNGDPNYNDPGLPATPGMGIYRKPPKNLRKFGLEVAGPPVATPQQREENNWLVWQHEQEERQKRESYEANEALRKAIAGAAGSSGKKKKGRSAEEIAADQARREALQKEKNDLRDAAAAWAEKARVVEQSARAELDTIKKLKDEFESFFGEWQNRLVEAGILNDPLGPLLRGLENLVGWAQKAKAVAEPAARSIQALQDAAAGNKIKARDLKASGSGKLAPANPALFAPAQTGAPVSSRRASAVLQYANDIAANFKALRAVPQEWGAAVKQTEETTYRFAMQSKLATSEGQQMLNSLAAAFKEKGFPEALAAFNKRLGTAFKVNGSGVKAAADFYRQISNYADYLGGNSLRPSKIDAAQKSLESLNAELVDQAKLARESAAEWKKNPLFSEDVEKRLAILQEKLRLWRDPNSPVVQLFKAGDKKGANKAFDQLLAGFIGKYDADRQNAKAQAAAADYSEKLKTAANDARDALKSGSEEINQLNEKRRLLELELKLRERGAYTEEQIARSVQFASTYQQKFVEYARKLVPALGMILGLVAASKLALGIAQGQAKTDDAVQRNDALKQLDQQKLELAKSRATFGDQTGFAGLEFELTNVAGKLNQLTDTEKDQYRVNNAALMGLQRYGQELDSLVSQQAQLAQQIAGQRARLGGLSPLQQQNRAWEQEDAADIKRLKGQPQANIDAYNERRPEVLKARENWRKLMSEQQDLALPLFLQDNQRRLQVGLETNDLKRARLELENQLRDAGWTDEYKIKIALDTNDAMNKAVQMQNAVQSAANDMANSFTDVFDDGLGRALNKGLGHIADWLAEVSKRILANWVVTQLFSALGIGNFLGGMGQAAGRGPQIGSAAASFTSDPIGPRKIDGSFAIGLPRVPYNGMQVMVHKNEAILTAQQAEQWRGLQSGEVSLANRGGSSSSGSNTPTVINNSPVINIGNVALPSVRDPEQFGPGIQRVSRRTLQQRGYDSVAGGRRQRSQ